MTFNKRATRGVRCCRGSRCGAPIRFVMTKRGRPMIVEATKVFLSAAHPKVITDEGEIVTVNDHLGDKIAGYEPHWVNCPDREAFRRRKAQR